MYNAEGGRSGTMENRTCKNIHEEEDLKGGLVGGNKKNRKGMPPFSHLKQAL